VTNYKKSAPVGGNAAVQGSGRNAVVGGTAPIEDFYFNIRINCAQIAHNRIEFGGVANLLQVCGGGVKPLPCSICIKPNHNDKRPY